LERFSPFGSQFEPPRIQGVLRMHVDPPRVVEGKVLLVQESTIDQEAPNRSPGLAVSARRMPLEPDTIAFHMLPLEVAGRGEHPQVGECDLHGAVSFPRVASTNKLIEFAADQRQADGSGWSGTQYWAFGPTILRGKARSRMDAPSSRRQNRASAWTQTLVWSMEGLGRRSGGHERAR